MQPDLSHVPLILLAGGRSSRMGRAKGLLKIGGRVWLDHQIGSFARLNGDRIALGLGYDALLYTRHLETVHQSRARISIHVNPEPSMGPFSTLKCCLAGLLIEQGDSDWDRCIMCPIDTPFPQPQTLQCLLAHTGWAVIPCFGGRGGHPVMLSRDFCREILEKTDARGRLDRLIAGLAPTHRKRITVNDERVTMNLNHPGDWDRFRRSEELKGPR